VKPSVAVSVYVLAATLWFSLAHSEEQKGVVQLPTVTVESTPEAPERTRSESQARKEIQRTPGGVALIGSQEIKETRATALQDVLDFVPGVMIRPRFGNVADESQISIRGSGLRNNYHLRGLTLLLDGFPLNNADGFGDVEAAELFATKRIEVYKGANALRFGVNSPGGAVNLVTRTGENSGLFEIRSQGGSFGFMKHQIATGQVYGPFDFYLGLTHTSQDGYRDHRELTRRRAYTSFGHLFDGGTMLRLDLNYVRSDQNLPGALTREEFTHDPTQRNPNNVAAKEARDFDYYRSAFTASIPLGETQTLDWFTQLNYQYLEHPLSFAVINQNTYNWGSELRYLLTAPLLGFKNRLTVGLQYSQTRQLEQWFENIHGNHGRKNRDQLNKATSIGLYAEEQLSVTDTLALVLGGRLQYARRAIDDAFLSDGNSSGSIEYIDVSPKAGFVWQVRPTIQIYGNASRAYEPPLLLEITAPGQLSSDLRLLNPQKAWQIEIGTRNNWDERLWWDVAVYDIALWDEIQNVNIQPFPNAPFTIPRFRNIDRSRHTGVEVATDFLLGKDVRGWVRGYSVGDTLRLRAAYTWSHFVFVDDDNFGNNDIPGAPEHFVRGELRYDHPMGLWFAPNLEVIPTGYFANTKTLSARSPTLS
jgi:iron complex outermembrane receptor protein